MSTTVSLSNLAIKIVNTNIDNLNQNMNFTIQSVANPSLQTNVYGSATLQECISLTQSQIVDLIWSRAAVQSVNWIQYVNRQDINIPSLNGSTYIPTTPTIPLSSASNVYTPGNVYTPPV
jgi:hypothetical protein